MSAHALLAALCVSALAHAAAARDITGEMAYPQRIALPEGAELRIELRSAEGVVAEATIATEGRQVPLPFLIVAPGPAEDYRLRGAVFAGGRAVWLSDEIAIPAGEGALAVGPVTLKRHVGMGLASRMRCGVEEVEVGFVGTDAVLRARGGTFVLPPAEAASGARFSDGASPETVFWSSGNTALVTARGEELPECVPVIGPPPLPLSARGNEPFWRLDLSETEFSLQTPDGTLREVRVPVAAAVAEGVRFELQPGLALTVERRVCRDSMSGMPHPATATLLTAERAHPGCAGDPVHLLEGGWIVSEVAGAALPAEADVTLAVDAAAGAVFGASGCNRYRGGLARTGEGLSFAEVAGTMMACPDAEMATERAFLAALGSVTRFDIAADGALELIAGDAVAIRARR